MPGDRHGLAVTELPDARPEDQRPAERRERGLQVDDRGPGEVLEAVLGQPPPRVESATIG